MAKERMTEKDAVAALRAAGYATRYKGYDVLVYTKHVVKTGTELRLACTLASRGGFVDAGRVKALLAEAG